MPRVALEALAFFLSPFVAYALYLTLRRGHPIPPGAWENKSALLIIGLLAVIGGLLLTASFAPRHTGAYQPAHIENGKVVPGRFE